MLRPLEQEEKRVLASVEQEETMCVEVASEENIDSAVRGSGSLVHGDNGRHDDKMKKSGIGTPLTAPVRRLKNPTAGLTIW